MTDEIIALEDNGTCTVVDLPPGKKALGSKWVYRIKFKADGTIERYKSVLVVLRNNQTGTTMKLLHQLLRWSRSVCSSN